MEAPPAAGGEQRRRQLERGGGGGGGGARDFFFFRNFAEGQRAQDGPARRWACRWMMDEPASIRPPWAVTMWAKDLKLARCCQDLRIYVFGLGRRISSRLKTGSARKQGSEMRETGLDPDGHQRNERQKLKSTHHETPREPHMPLHNEDGETMLNSHSHIVLGRGAVGNFDVRRTIGGQDLARAGGRRKRA
jgi:hypothetical protein